jgi:hypothetical protein
MANELSTTELSVVFNKLKTAFAQLRMHIEEYFADLINQVDMACEVYLDPSNKALRNLTANKLSERTEQARNDQVAIVEAIKVHQNECFMSFPKDEFDDIFSEEMNATLKEIEHNWNDKRLWVVYQKIEDCFLLLERRIFADKGFLFLKREDIELEFTEWDDPKKRSFERINKFKQTKRGRVKPFGVLIVWEDAFLPRAPSFW